MHPRLRAPPPAAFKERTGGQRGGIAGYGTARESIKGGRGGAGTEANIIMSAAPGGMQRRLLPRSLARSRDVSGKMNCDVNAPPPFNAALPSGLSPNSMRDRGWFTMRVQREVLVEWCSDYYLFLKAGCLKGFFFPCLLAVIGWVGVIGSCS